MAPTLTFAVRRQKPVLVSPVKPTPYELKPLSDIDDQQYLRFQVPFYFAYPYSPSMDGRDPCQVIKTTITQLLVYYYPFAGRLSETPNKKLVVECTGEGVLFIEADADVKLQEISNKLQPPSPYSDLFLHEVPGSGEILHSPLMLIQVTRLSCGGFIFALRFNHTMTDALGLHQFLKAASEIARGAEAPSLLPVWERHLLNADDPPHVSFSHYEYNNIPASGSPSNSLNHLINPPNKMITQSFFFGPNEIVALRNHLPKSLRVVSSTFDILTATLWRCRTAALHLVPSEQVRVLCIVNGRNKFKPPLPEGHYGNVLAIPAAVSSVEEELCGNSLGYAVGLVRKAKLSVTKEYFKSILELDGPRRETPIPTSTSATYIAVGHY
ncbi:hypothetical protein H6P81_017685 [Aristolochia fimbriata]|uniref:Uncharacterized protein n=1 Tax=Aristolochia fimbriata TaxID=158543 RepID=A0AAV7E0A9_ARIFI|nr:hypothetical protein H6P81_017685 [Aristolochia fimbriata]